MHIPTVPKVVDIVNLFRYLKVLLKVVFDCNLSGD